MPELSPTQVLARHYGSLATQYPMSNATTALADLKQAGYLVVRTVEAEQWRRTLGEVDAKYVRVSRADLLAAVVRLESKGFDTDHLRALLDDTGEVPDVH